ncbi:MAG: class B sortase [Angelakisella sp.]|nr:class B sortase [Angelakisella sp.]
MKKLIIALLLLIFIVLIGVSVALVLGFDSANPAVPAVKQGDSGSQSAEIGVMKPVDTMADVLEELSYEISQNSDTVGWLKVPGTTINNSVLQSHNNITYLRFNERKQEDIYGCYFADADGSIGSRDQMSVNTIIYGHSDLKDNPDGPRFSQLFKFTDESFARQTPYIYFSTLDDYMVWEVFAVFYTDTKMQYIYPNLENDLLTDIMNKAKLKSVYNYSVQVSESDKILTLSTCTVKDKEIADERFVIMAKLVPDGEELKVQANLEVNNDIEPPNFS